MILGLRAYIIQ